ncbi:nuclear pore complex, nucleoporin 88 family protein [Pseudohyphozyma bogoriensis]|nr:nuclear pore complex, nucleoporin 88 family protein [Pseudohyphozyma bogoriensis]
MSPSSWLQTLPSHEIFTLPYESSAKPLSTHPSLSELARPASPDISIASIFGSSTSSRVLRKSRSAHGGAGRKPAREEPTIGGRRSRTVLVRGTDLIVAVGSELRIASLSDVKGRCEDAESSAATTPEVQDAEREIEPGDYKVLSTPCINFEIQQLVLNETSKLLAVVGAHSVAVVVLPRKGWSGTLGRTLECRSLLVGKFYHSLPASPTVAEIGWHPWGDNLSSLLVLTSDCILREYSIGDDAEEPSQTISFAEPGHEVRKGGFSGFDEGSGEAVAFAIGEGKGDWGPLTVYCLMKSGDVAALCPFMPKKASIPSSYIHALSCFVAAKVEFLNTEPTSALTPFKASTSNSLNISTSSNRTIANSTTNDFESRYNLQLKYVNALVRQVAASVPKLAEDAMDVDDVHRLVKISPPAMARSSQPTRQGPFLLQPEPAILDHDFESSACDLTYVSYESSRVGKEQDDDSGAALGVFAITYTDGKVDLCLEVEKVEARWGEPDGDEEDLPSLAVYETIDLGLFQGLPEDSTALIANHPTIIKDPLYPDTLYVYHAFGVHCLLLTNWLDAVADITNTTEDDDEKLQKEVERTLRAQKPTDVLWILKTVSLDETTEAPVVGFSIVNDVYLGYSALMITSALQLVGIELSLRVDPSLLPSTTSATPATSTQRGVSSDPPAYLSLLDTPFTIPPPFDKRSGVSTVPRLALKPPPGSSKAVAGKSELVITPDTLRFMGKTVETFRHEIRDLVAGADVVQCRLELQMKELSRQLKKLEELSKLSDTLRRSTASAEGLGGRLERVAKNQEALLQRTDRVLQRLMDAHEPLLSTYEKKWFEELGRLEKEVLAGKGGDTSLERRAERVVAQLDSLRPALEELKAKQGGGGQAKVGTPKSNGLKSNGSLDSPSVMGETQMKRLETKLAEDRMDRVGQHINNTTFLMSEAGSCLTAIFAGACSWTATGPFAPALDGYSY